MRCRSLVQRNAQSWVRFKSFVFPSTVRQMEQSSKAPLAQKFSDMLLLNRGWSCFGGSNEPFKGHPVELAIEIFKFLQDRDIDCAIGGSIALSMYTTPRMTKDADINVDICVGQISEVCDMFKNAGHTLDEPIEWGGGSRVKPEYRNEKMLSSLLKYKGLGVDLYFNTCRATQWAHQHARPLLFPQHPELGKVKFVSPECLAYFKLFGMQGKKWKRSYKDMADLEQLTALESFDFKMVDERITAVFGEKSHPLSVLRKLQQTQQDERRQKAKGA